MSLMLVRCLPCLKLKKGTYHRISLADAIGLATAKELSGQFATSDHHELEKIEQQEPYQFLWIR
jgi:predicted nucleic acid-binding protein